MFTELSGDLLIQFQRVVRHILHGTEIALEDGLPELVTAFQFG